MGTKHNCDNCGADIPLASAIRPLIIGEEKIMDLCLTCASKTKTAMIQEKSKIKTPAPGEIPEETIEEPAVPLEKLPAEPPAAIPPAAPNPIPPPA